MPYWGALFGQPIRITVPAELADEAALLAYLGLGAAELKKIWYLSEADVSAFLDRQRPE